MDKERQKQLQMTLFGLGEDKKPYPPQHYAQLPMQDLILLHHMANAFIQNNAKNLNQKVFFTQRMGFFERQIVLKLWALKECYALVHKENDALYTEKNEKTGDNQIFVFSTKEYGEAVVKTLNEKNSNVALHTVTHPEFPPFYLNLFSRAITAVIIDRGQTAIGMPLWAVCGQLKEDFVLEKSRPAVRLWTKKEIYILYSDLTRLPYVECDSETFDDAVFVYTTKAAAEKAVEQLKENNIPVSAHCIQNRDFHKNFFELFLMGVNAIHTEHDGLIQVTNMVPKPDFSKAPADKQPIINPEFLLTAAYVCQAERRPGADPNSDELKQLKEEMLTHLRESNLGMPVFMKEGEGERPQFPIVTLTNGEQYCPVFTDIQTAKLFEEKEREKLLSDGTPVPEFKYVRMNFDNIIKALPPQLMGVIVNPNTINLMMRKTEPKKAGEV